MTKINKSLNGFRGFAALGVVVFHLWSGAADGGFFPSALEGAVRDAGLSLIFGVELFFMISGYLITKSLLRHADVRSFLRDRLIRIYPAFLPLITLLFAAGPAIGYDYFDGVGPLEWTGLFIANVLFLPGLFPVPAALLVAWTLSFEAAFYLYCSAIYTLSRRVRRPALIVVLLLSTAFFIAVFPRTLFFAIGAVIFFYQEPLRRHAKWLGTLSPVFVVLFFALLLFFHGAAYFSVPSLGWAQIEPALRDQPAVYLLAALAGAITLLLVVDERGVFAALLRTGVMQWLGMVSYSLYLWHTPIMFVTKKVSTRVFAQAGDWPAFLFFCGSSLAIALPTAWLSYRLLERGVPTLLDRRARTPQAAMR